MNVEGRVNRNDEPPNADSPTLAEMNIATAIVFQSPHLCVALKTG
jgi:hypothetical protein